MKKLGLIGLILIVALSSVGFASGAWTPNFNSSGPVSTGSFDVVFDSFTAPTSSYGAGFSVYQVNSHTCEISLSDLYPSLDGTFNFTLKNTGTIPAKITDIKIDGVSGLTEDKDLGSPGDGNTDIRITVSGISNTTTIAAGGTVSGTLTVHTWSLSADDKDATANAGGSFTLEIDTAQRY